MRCGELVVEWIDRVFRSAEKKAVNPLEIAVDLFNRYDLVDLVDRGGVTVRRQTRAFLTVQLFDFKISIVESIGEMGSGSARHTTATQTVIQHYDRSAFSTQQVGRRQPGNARAADTDVGADA